MDLQSVVIGRDVRYLRFPQITHGKQLPWEQRLLSCMAFSVYEVIRVACLSRNCFVDACEQTNYATDKQRERLLKS